MRCQTSVFISTIIGAVTMVVAANNVHIDVVEYNKMRMIYTSPDHYAIYDPDFKSNWQAFSYNSQSISILGRDNRSIIKNWSALTKPEMDQVESSKALLNNIRWKGPNSVSGYHIKISSYDQFGSMTGSISGGTSSMSSSSSSSSMSINGMSVSKSGDNDYVISKNDLPFNWIRLFINDKIVSTVNKDGLVFINHMDSLSNEERVKINEIMDQIKKMDSVQSNMMKSMMNPFDFVNKAMSGMFGR